MVGRGAGAQRGMCGSVCAATYTLSSRRILSSSVLSTTTLLPRLSTYSAVQCRPTYTHTPIHPLGGSAKRRHLAQGVPWVAEAGRGGQA